MNIKINFFLFEFKYFEFLHNLYYFQNYLRNQRTKKIFL